MTPRADNVAIAPGPGEAAIRVGPSLPGEMEIRP